MVNMTKLLYRIYLLLIALPLVVVATILAGVLTIIGTALGAAASGATGRPISGRAYASPSAG